MLINGKTAIAEIKKQKTWIFLLALCLVYWAYLIFHTEMLVLDDAAAYESAGKAIYQKGWQELFRIKWYKEPLYPALIALSMACADFLSVNYHLILKVFQVLLLFLTQVLLIILLRRLCVRDGIVKAAVFYFGISPAVINAAFSMFYEIVSFPFVIAVVLLAGSLWSDVIQKRRFRLILWKAALFGACFGLLTLGRGVFQYVFYFFVFPFCISIFFVIFNKKKFVMKRLLVFISAAFIVFYSAISYVKLMNLCYNGQYLLYDSHSSILLGSAFKRSQPISSRIIASHIASIPGTGICRLFFSRQECDYASYLGSCQFRLTDVAQSMENIPRNRQARESVRLVIKKAAGHPFQYLFFSAIEALKMPFWESTQIGFVRYPRFLTEFYGHPASRFALRLIAGLATIAAFIFVSLYLWRVKRLCFSLEDDRRNMIMLFFVWLMIMGYTFFYSLCYVVTRHALPIVSMYVVCISFAIDRIINRNFENS